MEITRSNIESRAESGGEVFEELASLLGLSSEEKTISSVMAQYKKDVGLDIVTSEEEFEDHQLCKSASDNNYFSNRHKIFKTASAINDPNIARYIESFCSESGGHKSVHSIITALRDITGISTIGYDDKKLIDFIEKCQYKHKDNVLGGTLERDVGKEGTKNFHNYEDNQADYFRSAK